MNFTQYTIDPSLMPTTFDLWHVCLLGTVAVLGLILIIVLLSCLMVVSRTKKGVMTSIVEKPQPEIQIVEKIIEVEKIVEVEKLIEAPVPEPVILKETTSDAALQLLGFLQKEARFIDFIKEDITHYSDTDIGVAARVVHKGCNTVINDHFKLISIRDEEEGAQITLKQNFDASIVRLTGNVVGKAPFTGELVHKGWQITKVQLPKLTAGYDPHIIAPAEVVL